MANTMRSITMGSQPAQVRLRMGGTRAPVCDVKSHHACVLTPRRLSSIV